MEEQNWAESYKKLANKVVSLEKENEELKSSLAQSLSDNEGLDLYEVKIDARELDELKEEIKELELVKEELSKSLEKCVKDKVRLKSELQAQKNYIQELEQLSCIYTKPTRIFKEKIISKLLEEKDVLKIIEFILKN